MALQDFRAVCLPYCLKKQEDNTFLVLNRDYKPLSFCTFSNDFENQNLPIYLKIKGLTPRLITKITAIGKGASLQKESNTLFLYNDSNNPIKGKQAMKDYLERLEILMPLTIQNEP